MIGQAPWPSCAASTSRLQSQERGADIGSRLHAEDGVGKPTTSRPRDSCGYSRAIAAKVAPPRRWRLDAH